MRQRPVDEYPDVVLARVGEQLGLDIPSEQVVRRLHRLHRARPRELGHLSRVEVRDADVADLAFVHELLKRRGGLGKGHLRVGPVHLVDVDVVDFERAQAVLDSAAKPGGTGIADETLVGHPQAALGRDHDLLAPVVEVVAQRPAEESLRGAEAVTLSGVEKVDSELASTANRGDPLVLVELPPLTPQLPGAEGNRGDLQASHAECDGVQDAGRHGAPFSLNRSDSSVAGTVSAAPCTAAPSKSIIGRLARNGLALEAPEPGA